jgi:hypothetical protein
VRGFACIASAVAIAVGAGASGTVAATPLPSASSLLLTPGDFDGGATSAGDTSYSKAGVQLTLRILKGAKLGGRPLFAVAEGLIERDENAATSEFAVTRTEVGLKVEKAAIANLFAAAFAKGAKLGSNPKATVTVKHSVIGRPVDVGNAAFRVPMTFVTSIGTLRVSLGVAHADRAIGIIILIPLKGNVLQAGKVAGIVAAEERHLRAAFTVANVSAPTITGTPQQGQTLTASLGSWSGAPSSFSYAWSRCDPTGSACSPIAGATSRTYVAAAADAGSTVRVAVTGSNSLGSAQASSPPSGVIM